MVKAAGRGPGYPFIDLESAVEKAREFYSYAKRAEVEAAGLVKHWGYSEKSSSGVKAIAALKYYGLMDERGEGEKRQVKLTERAYRILIDHEASPQRKQALKDAAISPKQFKYCWDTWGRDLPSDDAMRSHLIFQRGFVEGTVGAFIQDYKKTIRYAGLMDDSGERDEETSDPKGAKIGDYIQWESQGVLQFGEPKLVSRLSDDGSFVFIEGSSTGIPAGEAKVVQPPAAPPASPAAAIPAAIVRTADKGAGMKQDTFSLVEGDVSLIWPSSLSESSYKDLEDWLELMRRKIQRAVKSDQEQSPQGQPQ